MFLKLGIVERTESLILHLDLAESFALERALKELLGLGCKLPVELVAKLGKPLLTLLVAQVGWQLVAGLVVLLHQIGILLADVRKLLVRKTHLFTQGRVAKQRVLQRRVSHAVLTPLVRQPHTTSRLSRPWQANPASRLGLLRVTEIGAGDIRVDVVGSATRTGSPAVDGVGAIHVGPATVVIRPGVALCGTIRQVIAAIVGVVLDRSLTRGTVVTVTGLIRRLLAGGPAGVAIGIVLSRLGGGGRAAADPLSLALASGCDPCGWAPSRWCLRRAGPLGPGWALGHTRGWAPATLSSSR